MFVHHVIWFPTRFFVTFPNDLLCKFIALHVKLLGSFPGWRGGWGLWMWTAIFLRFKQITQLFPFISAECNRRYGVQCAHHYLRFHLVDFEIMHEPSDTREMHILQRSEHESLEPQLICCFINSNYIFSQYPWLINWCQASWIHFVGRLANLFSFQFIYILESLSLPQFVLWTNAL